MKRRTKFLTQYLFFSIFFSYNAWTEGNLLVCYLGTAWHYMKQKILRLFFNIYYGFYFKVLVYMFLLHFDEICSKILRVMLLNRRSITGNNVILFYVQCLYPTVGFVSFFVYVSLQRCAHKYKQYVVKHPCELYDQRNAAQSAFTVLPLQSSRIRDSRMFVIMIFSDSLLLLSCLGLFCHTTITTTTILAGLNELFIIQDNSICRDSFLVVGTTMFFL